MKRLPLTSQARLMAIGVLGLLAPATDLPVNAAEEETYNVYTTPKGTYQLMTHGDDKPEVFVTMKGSSQLEPLLDAEWEDPSECTVIYHGSPDENWIFRSESWRHHAVQGRQFYHHEKGAKFVYYKGKEWFTNAIVAYAIKAGGFKKTDFYMQRGPNYFEDHLYAAFRDWSPDSSRLLLCIAGDYIGSETTPRRWYVYFNTRTKGFELSPYLAELNKLTAEDDTETARPCAEPIDALPAEAELKARAEKAEQELKEWFVYREAHPKGEETAEDWQSAEEEWSKARDEGLKLYLQFAPEKEREKRRLQFLGDVAEAKLAYCLAAGGQ